MATMTEERSYYHSDGEDNNLDTSQHKEKAEGQPKVYDDGTNTFFWQAHTVTALIIISIGLIYVSLIEQTPDDTVYNIQRGVVAVLVVFIFIGVIHMPDGPFVRPHPVLWRFVLCVTILYVLSLIFMLFQTADDARRYLKVFDSDLGKPLDEMNYATDCRIYSPDHPDGPFANVWDKLDVFVPSHFFGWWVKSLVLRDWFLLTVLSIGFELAEYTLEVHLPNFGECWWDHWIMDALICNSLGIWCGMMTCHYLEMKAYHWRGLWKIPTFKGKVKRLVSQFTPYSWTNYHWGYSESFARFIAVCVLVTWMMLQELNTFYLKAILWVPPNHFLNLYRALLYAFAGACACFEIYYYLSTKEKNVPIGRFIWLTFIAIVCECLLVIKMGWDILIIPLPRIALVFWSTFAAVFAVWVFWQFTFPFKHMPFIGPYYRKLIGKIKSL